MKYKFLIVALAVSEFFTGCHKDDSSTLIPLSSCLKNYGAFKVGSYWIYKKDSSSIRDSIYVTQCIPGKEASETDNHIDYYESFLVKLKSTLESTANLSIEVNGHNPFVIYYYFNWKTSLDCRGRAPVSNSYDSLLINNIMYYSVSEYQRSNVPDTISNVEYRQFWSLKTYFQSEKGLLKWEVVNADSSYESWSLLSSQVYLN